MDLVPGDTSTTYTISDTDPGIHFLDFEGECDWFRAELDAGVVYTMTSSGSVSGEDKGSFDLTTGAYLALHQVVPSVAGLS